MSEFCTVLVSSTGFYVVEDCLELVKVGRTFFFFFVTVSPVQSLSLTHHLLSVFECREKRFIY